MHNVLYVSRYHQASQRIGMEPIVCEEEITPPEQFEIFNKAEAVN